MQNTILQPKWDHPYRTILKLLREQVEIFIQQRVKPDDRVCDVGAGTSPYKSLFPKEVQYLGADIKENDFKNILIDENGDILAPTETFDIVLSTQVLEHVPNVNKYLSECYRILKPTGRLFLSTHGVWPYHPTPTDYWRWTGPGLSKTVEEAGFEIVNVAGLVSPTGFAFQTLQFSISRRFPFFISAALNYLSQSTVLWLHKRADSSRLQQDACVFCLDARKPC